MNPRRLSLALALLIPMSALAWGGKLSTLTVFYPADTPAETAKKVNDYLTQDVTLVEGKFINEFITQTFSCSTAKLNELISLLRTNQFDLTVTFADLADGRLAFSLYQSAGEPGKATITVNMTAKDFKLSDLKIHIAPAKRNIEPDSPTKASPTKTRR
jgi:hypothetical protein